MARGEDPMKVKVTEKGLLIPRKFLKGVKEVEVRRQNDLIVIVPLGAKDPIFDIGKNPVKLGLKDASVNHDKYVAQQEEHAAKQPQFGSARGLIKISDDPDEPLRL